MSEKPTRGISHADGFGRTGGRGIARTLGALLALGAALASPFAHGEPKPLAYTTSWVGNTFGGADNKYVPIGVEAIHVTQDGTMFTNTPWDEAGGEISEIRDGRIVRFAGGTHGWGDQGGDAITANSQYVYAGMSLDNENGGLAERAEYPPKGHKWFGLTRRKRDDIGEGAPFEDGLGNLGRVGAHSFLKINDVPDKVDAGLRGLASDDTRVYVANPYKHRIQVFDADTLHEVAGWQVDDPRALVLDRDGTLWAVAEVEERPAILHFSKEGKPLPAKLELGRGVLPVALAFDPQGRLLVADNGPGQQVLIFSKKDGAWRQTGTFGVTHGVYAGPRPGRVGPGRFNGLTGVGVDHAGNIYVSTNGVGPRRNGDFNRGTGAVFERYATDGKRDWRLEGLLFVDGMALDPGDPSSAYSGTHRFTLNFAHHAPGSEWTYVAYTADRFRYPDDPLFNAEQHDRGMPMVRRLDGKRFLFFTDMFSHYLKVYRFDEKRAGEIAIPSVLFTTRPETGAWPRSGHPGRGEWIWRDANGNGRLDPGEYSSRGADAPESRAWWVDTDGNVWRGGTDSGIRCYVFQGLDKVGNPIYDYTHARLYAMPEPFNMISRVQYNAADDTMMITGSTKARPYDNSNWNGVGFVLARYAHWSKKPELIYAVDLPLNGTGHAIGSIVAEGDFIFAVESRTAIVHVFDIRHGHEIGIFKPGPSVGETSGWIDVPAGITAYRRDNGEYIVAVEEDLRGKVVMYRWTPAHTR